MRTHHWIALSVLLFLAFGFAAWLLIVAMLIIMLADDIRRHVMRARRPVRAARLRSVPSLGYRAAGGQVVVANAPRPLPRLTAPNAPPR